jgi:2-iminoacetate synthase
MFSNIYEELSISTKEIIGDVKLPTPKETQEILQKSLEGNLPLEDSVRLLEIGNHPEAQEQFDLMREFTYLQFRNQPNKLRHIAPVYLSSYCIDTCGYCNFSAKRKDVKRARLELSRLEEELSEVLGSGNRVIEFTLATDPEFTPEVLAEYISKTREILSGEQGSGILLCSDHFTEEKYRNLKEAGLWGIVQWDETLDKEIYEKWHKSSPRKSDFTTRTNNHDRAIHAGLEVATGCLFGLSDFRYDVLMQLAKIRYLGQEHGIKPFVFGTPRLKPIAGKQLHPKFEVNDRQYETALMVYKISEPNIARWLQTRESPELNLRNILDGDFYTYRCGEVKPGGYKVNINSLDTCKGGQFGVSEMTSKQFEEELNIKGFRVDYSWIR